MIVRAKNSGRVTLELSVDNAQLLAAYLAMDNEDEVDRKFCVSDQPLTKAIRKALHDVTFYHQETSEVMPLVPEESQRVRNSINRHPSTIPTTQQ